MVSPRVSRPTGHTAGAEPDPQSHLAGRQVPVIPPRLSYGGTTIPPKAAASIQQTRKPFHTTQRPSAFQEVYHPEGTYLEKAPAAQLTRIDAADRLFSVPLTRITSVPECAV